MKVIGSHTTYCTFNVAEQVIQVTGPEHHMASWGHTSFLTLNAQREITSNGFRFILSKELGLCRQKRKNCFLHLGFWIWMVFNNNIFSFYSQRFFHTYSIIKQLFIVYYHIQDPENREYILKWFFDILNLNHIFNLQSVLTSLGV